MRCAFLVVNGTLDEDLNCTNGTSCLGNKGLLIEVVHLQSKKLVGGKEVDWLCNEAASTSKFCPVAKQEWLNLFGQVRALGDSMGSKIKLFAKNAP